MPFKLKARVSKEKSIEINKIGQALYSAKRL